MSLSHLGPIPNLLNAKRVLCIQPHPDDVESPAVARWRCSQTEAPTSRT